MLSFIPGVPISLGQEFWQKFENLTKAKKSLTFSFQFDDFLAKYFKILISLGFEFKKTQKCIEFFAIFGAQTCQFFWLNSCLGH